MEIHYRSPIGVEQTTKLKGPGQRRGTGSSSSQTSTPKPLAPTLLLLLSPCRLFFPTSFLPSTCHGRLLAGTSTCGRGRKADSSLFASLTCRNDKGVAASVSARG